MNRQALQKKYEEFWIGFRCSNAKLRLFQFAFFLVFALDAWLQIAHAPRYGHGNFNVSHFPLLDGLLPIPSRSSMVLLYSLQAYLGLRLAFGAASRLLYVLLALVFSYGYFISQLNSYQHHYLLAIVLVLLAFVPWPGLQKQQDSTAKNWPIRMLLVAVSVMYFYAFLAKLDGQWLDGSTLKVQLSADWARSIADSVGWATLAILAMLAELALVFLLHYRKAWPLTMLMGISMHLAFEYSGLDIGLFSYFMVTLYLLLLPESWLEKAKRWLPATRPSWWISPSKNISWGIVSVCLALGVLLQTQFLLPADSQFTLALLFVVIAAADLGMGRQPFAAGLQHLLAILLLLVFTFQTHSIRDYYRYWGGNARRSGQIAEAISAYAHVVNLDPSYVSGRSNLGNLYLRAQREEEALQQFEAGMTTSANHFGVHWGAAQIYHRKAMGPQALRAAKVAVKLKPKHKGANRVLRYWLQKQSPNAPRP